MQGGLLDKITRKMCIHDWLNLIKIHLNLEFGCDLDQLGWMWPIQSNKWHEKFKCVNPIESKLVQR
jgi:hypothetical protein